MKHLKKILSFALVVMMCWGLFPVGAANAARTASGVNGPKYTWFWPVGDGIDYTDITSTYPKDRLSSGGYREHSGIDIGNNGRTDHIYAAAEGVIEDIRINPNNGPSEGYGTYIQIRHNINNNTYYTIYAHLAEVNSNIIKGKNVAKGQEIGIMGNTGNSFGRHLHFEILNAEYKSINPTPKSFNGILVYDVYRYDDNNWETAYTTQRCNHEFRDNQGYCKNERCDNRDYLLTDWVANSRPYSGTATPRKGTPGIVPKARPYNAAEDRGSLSKAKIVRVGTNHYGNTWYQLQIGDRTDLFVYSEDVIVTPSAGRIEFKNISYPPLSFDEGRPHGVLGTVESVHTIDTLTIGIYNSNGTQTPYVVTRSNINNTSYDLAQHNYDLMFSKLAAGTYRYKIQATDTIGHSEQISTAFSVVRKNLPVYQVSFDLNGGYGSGQIFSISAGQNLNLSFISAPSRYNYNFLGWSADKKATVPTYSPTASFSPSNHITLYAVWKEIAPPSTPIMTVSNLYIGTGKTAQLSWQAIAEANTYTIAAYTQSGGEYTSATTNTAQAALLFRDAGVYTVKVKAANTAGESAYSDGVTVTVYAPSTVRFRDYNGSEIVQSVGYQESAVMPTLPERQGYRFTGWDGSLINVTENRTLNAVYQALPYTVKFLDYLGNTAKTETVYYQDDTPGAATPPDASVLNIPTGYVLAGWDTNDYQAVTRTGIVVKPSVIWGNQDVPITTEITSVSKAGDGYWVDYVITNHGDTSRTGRVVIVLKSNFGKFLTKTESGAFYLVSDASYSGNQYVPLTATLQGEIFTTVEAYVVSSYTSLSPISEPDFYSMISDDGDWSRWMTAEELTQFEGAYTDTETKTQYRTSAKQTIITEAPSYLDWLLDHTSTYKSEWGNWSSWQDTAITANDYRDVRTQQVMVTGAYNLYRYGRYYSTNCSQGSWAHFNDIYAQSIYGGTWYTRYSEWSTTRYPIASSYYGYTVGNNSLGNGIWDSNRYYWHKYTVDGTNYYWEEINTIPATYKTQYSYRTRTDVTQYHFYKWADWTAWSDAPAAENDNLQVQTRIMTRVKLPEPPDEGLRTLSGTIGDLPGIEGKQAILTVYKVDEASDYSNEYIGQTTLGADGAYAFSFRTYEEPSVSTGDFTATLTIEGADNPMYIGTIPAPKPTYQVEFVDMDGTRIGAVQTVDEGGRTIAPECPVKEGYTFIGWEYGLSNIRDNMTIAARYAPNKYTVVFADFANGTLSMQTDILHGSQLTLPEVQPMEGYTFLGWQAPQGFDINNVTGSMIVTAQYEQLRYTVRFLNANGELISEQVIGHGELPVLPDENAVTVTEGKYFADWSANAYAGVTQPLEILPIVYCEEDAALPQVSLTPGIYEGEQTLEITCDDEDTVITYSFLQAHGSTGGNGFSVYEGPITLTHSATVEVTCSNEGANDTSETFDYTIVPEGSKPTKPEAVTAAATEEHVALSWDDVEDADGYIINKSDIFGAQERFMTQDTSYTDENVIGITDYTYTVSSYSMIEESGQEVFLESETASTPATVTFFGEFKPVTGIEVIAPSTNVTLGDNVQLTAVVTPSDAFNQAVTWSVTPGTGNATISSNGVLTATAEGTVTVTATAQDEGAVSGSLELTIQAQAANSVPLRVGSAILRKGTSANVSVTIGENSQAAMIQFALLYDATKLTLTSCEAGDVMASQDPTINSLSPGVIYFIWDATTGLEVGGSLLDLAFTAADDAEEQDVILDLVTENENYDFVFMKLIGNDALDIDVAAYDGKLSIQDILLGDASFDGKINVIDANMVRRHAAKLITLDEAQLLAADVSGDGSVNVIDANYIRRYAARLIDTFPAA